MNSRHTLSVLVENKPGVLARLTGLIARRGFNIHSLAVGVTEHEGLSRITVVVDVEDVPLEQVTKQLNKLVNVIKIVELEAESSVRRAHVIYKVKANASTRPQVASAVDMFRAKIVDVSTDSVSVEVTGEQGKVDALRDVLEPFGIKEIVQSGMVAIGRGSKSITDRALRG
ncbi:MULTISPECIES: acetolactate synthase small subunit [unclassified Brevibacterium]|uniref:acetolactate synthase small subunit n=1 Tax=unclassified Brevibacterium TaxID=2614124 RepID=UPI001E5A4086|nr:MULTISPECIES: acetolactate synthase small subunit [unclassified Brevibacterium]MCD1285836.1 acetolactate synthase small subunit [Brevibacterium sp. CCUG 69071]MDK8434897.1 acetolactate synthase small subunit [Brevibacterium sp. H-BE7]